MGRVEVRAHAAAMVEFVVLAVTALLFAALLAAVPLEISEERQDERRAGVR